MTFKLSGEDPGSCTIDSSAAGYGCGDVVPRGYASLMDLYENNYLRFRRLVDNLDAIDVAGASHVSGCQSVYLKIVDRSRYTTTVGLTYLFEEDDCLALEPDLRLRLYHDAGLLEVLAGHLRHVGCRSGHTQSKSLKSKWRLNRFLYKWLGYCLYLGHRIGPESPVSERAGKRLFSAG